MREDLAGRNSYEAAQTRERYMQLAQRKHEKMSRKPDRPDYTVFLLCCAIVGGMIFALIRWGHL